MNEYRVTVKTEAISITQVEAILVWLRDYPMVEGLVSAQHPTSTHLVFCLEAESDFEAIEGAARVARVAIREAGMSMTVKAIEVEGGCR